MLVGPLIPDRDLVVLQVLDVGVALQEPEQFDDDGAQVQLLGRHHREAVFEVEAQLASEDSPCARAGAVAPFEPVLQGIAQKIEILLHGSGLLSCSGRPQTHSF